MIEREPMQIPPHNGDRIRLVSMQDDPDTVEPGQTGTVVHVSPNGAGRDAWLQNDVEWDNG